MSREQYEKYFNGNIDIYRICRLYNINDPALYHGVKKILRLGSGDKSKEQDIKEAIACLERWLEMEEEDKESNSSDLKEAMKRDDMSGRAKSIRDRMTKFSTTKINKILKRLGKVFEINVPHITPGIGSEELDDFISDLDHDQIDYLRAIVHDYESEIEEEVESKADQYLNSLVDDLMSMPKKHYQPVFHEINEELVPSIPSMRDRNYKDLKEWASELEGDELTKVARIIENKKTNYPQGNDTKK